MGGTPKNQELTGKYHRKSIFFVKPCNDPTVPTVILVETLCRISTKKKRRFLRKLISLRNKKRGQNIPVRVLIDV